MIFIPVVVIQSKHVWPVSCSKLNGYFVVPCLYCLMKQFIPLTINGTQEEGRVKKKKKKQDFLKNCTPLSFPELKVKRKFRIHLITFTKMMGTFVYVHVYGPLYTIEQFMLYKERSFTDYQEKHNTRKTEYCHTMLCIILVN